MLWAVKITQAGLNEEEIFFGSRSNWKFRGRVGFGVDSVPSCWLGVLVILLSWHFPTCWFCP